MIQRLLQIELEIQGLKSLQKESDGKIDQLLGKSRESVDAVEVDIRTEPETKTAVI